MMQGRDPTATSIETMRHPPAQPTPPAIRLFRHLCRSFSQARSRPARETTRGLHRGDYRATADELFRIEDLGPERAIVERVRTGELIDIGLEELGRLSPVRPAEDTHRSLGTTAGQHTQEVPDGSRWT